MAALVQRNVVGHPCAIGTRGVGIDARFVEDQDAAAEGEAFREVMGDHEHRQPGFPPQLQQQLMHVLANAGVEGAEGLVQQQHAGLHHQRLGDGQSLLHAAGELCRVLVQRMAEADLVQHLRSLLTGIALAASEQTTQQRGARQFQAEGDVVQHRQVRKYRVALKNHAAAGVRFVCQWLAIQQDLATAGRFLAEQQPQEGRLAATGGTDQGAELTFGNLQVQALQHHLVAILLPDIPDLDERSGIACAAAYRCVVLQLGDGSARNGCALSVAHALAPSYQGNSSWVRRRSERSMAHASRVIQAT